MAPSGDVVIDWPTVVVSVVVSVPVCIAWLAFEEWLERRWPR